MVGGNTACFDRGGLDSKAVVVDEEEDGDDDDDESAADGTAIIIFGLTGLALTDGLNLAPPPIPPVPPPPEPSNIFCNDGETPILS